MGDKLNELNELKAKLKNGDADAIKKQHALGKMTARERLLKLFDQGSFVETGVFVKHRAINFNMEKKDAPLEGVITGYGQIGGRLVYAVSQDFTVLNGSIGEMHARKISDCQKNAMKVGAPIITIYDNGGARIEEGLDALSGYGEILKNNALASGVIPQIAIVMGNTAGILSASVAMNDFVFMVDKTSHMFLNGPLVINSTNKENITADTIGSAITHSSITGIADFNSQNEDVCIEEVKILLNYLPQNNLEKPEVIENNDDINRVSSELNAIVNNNSYDMKNVIMSVADINSFFETKKDFAKNIITGFIRLGGRVVGVVANNPSVDNAVLDINSLNKASSFIKKLDSFNIPILTFEDTNGFKISTKEEQNGIINSISKLINAYADSTVGLVTLITKKAYGGGYIAMCPKEIGADLVYAWPEAEIGVMNSEGAANILYDEDIKNAKDPLKEKEAKIKEYDDKMMNPYVAASRGYIDDIIEPATTRKYLISAFDALLTKVVDKKKKKHGNI